MQWRSNGQNFIYQRVKKIYDTGIYNLKFPYTLTIKPSLHESESNHQPYYYSSFNVYNMDNMHLPVVIKII